MVLRGPGVIAAAAVAAEVASGKRVRVRATAAQDRRGRALLAAGMALLL